MLAVGNYFHQDSDITSAVEAVFVDEIAALNITDMLGDSLQVVSVTNSGLNVVVVVSAQMVVLEIDDYVCTDVRCDTQNACTACEA